MTACPIDYCLHYKTNISLHHPDMQCKPHRTILNAQKATV